MAQRTSLSKRKHVLTGHALDPHEAANLSAYRHRKATAERERRDRVWFRNHPGRSHRIRPARPFEHEGVTDTSVGMDASLVVRAPGTIESISIHLPVRDWTWLPDDEYFLALLWESMKIEKGNDGHLTTISVERHKGLLLTAGLWRDTA